jgi:hypothetical protein
MNEWHKLYLEYQKSICTLPASSKVSDKKSKKANKNIQQTNQDHSGVNVVNNKEGTKTTNIPSKKIPELGALVKSPTCVEMILSTGHSIAPFDGLSNTTLQSLASDNGGLLLATLWLDIFTWHRVSRLVEKMTRL